MPQVSALYDGVFAEITGCHGEAMGFAGASVADLVAALIARHGQPFREAVVNQDTGDVTVTASILVNGGRMGLSDPLADGDEVTFLMPFPGG
ncbi:MAG: MoaD/ThiS family protein [Dehalococcoidia bacterium]|jgi:molybdopterin converting factor small subunit|nr:MoaD/ThiS family protein [Dehalococcoidia bacterium]MDP7240012.1 MoaD/ThiS family protein [Dehalococcoidia bacterium]MDP7470203.1 MoaD/ThiS family protein [Dehalococcoidia bacterium]